MQREFLGSVRTLVFEVHPKAERKDSGRFSGRIWVEDQGGNVSVSAAATADLLRVILRNSTSTSTAGA